MEKISRSMKENQVTVQLLCAGCDEIIVRPMRLGVKEQVDCLVVYIESAVSNMMLEDSVIGKLLNRRKRSAGQWRRMVWGFLT